MNIRRFVFLFALTLFLCSCAGTQQNTAVEPDNAEPADTAKQGEYAGIAKIEGATIESVAKEPELSMSYDNIIFHPFQIDDEYASDYADALMQCQTSTISHLKMKKAYKRVEESEGTHTGYKGKTLIVDAKITDIRIVGTGTRIWAGPFAGSSFMDVYLKLTDASTRKVVHQKIISTSNNAMASAWAPGSETGLPIDMGKIVGEYLSVIVPGT